MNTSLPIQDYPPLYTLQPVLSTREKQLEMWRSIILQQCGEKTTMVIDIASYPTFTNEKIKRSLDREGRLAVCEALVKTGQGEWEDPATKSRLRVYGRTADAWAAIIYDWAKATARTGGSICTLFEIHSWEDSDSLAGLHPEICLKALRVLEKSGKAQVYLASVVDETGVKFL
jgi:ESCRT-II complex subunit VPS25